MADHSAPTSAHGTRRTLTLRVRLTLWVVVIAAVVQLSISLVALLYQARAIRSLFDDQLQLRASNIIEGLPPNPAVTPPDRIRQLADRTSLLIFFAQVRLAIFDLDGNPVAFDTEHAPPRMPEAVALAIEQGQSAFADWYWEDPDDPVRLPVNYRTYAMPITAGESAPAGLILWVASSNEYAAQRTQVVRRAVMLTTLAGMVGTGIAGWFIAGIAVRPLDRLRVAVSGLSAQRMSLARDDEGVDPEVSELREELDRAMKRIEAGYAAYGRFIANVSHELKTPIAVCLTEAEVLLQRSDLDGSSRLFVKSMAEEMRRLGQLVESFLTLTRVREGKLDTSLRNYPINELLMDSIEHCSAFARQQSISLHPTLIEDPVDASVNIDPDLMRTAIDNLIRNAVRFSAEGGFVEVCATVSVAEQAARISVRDFGPGIPDEVLPVIFDRFSQADTETRAGRGTGLGLEISQGIAELHGGHIAVENLDQGCIFTLILPLATQQTAPAA